MKLANKKKPSVNGFFNNQQNVIQKVHVNNYVKSTVLVLALIVCALFSKNIQHIFTSHYNQSAAFVQKHTTSIIVPLGV